jgi:hypothetical protein
LNGNFQRMVIFRIFVSLLEIEPPIWRRIELSSRTTLKQFHRILQIAMGWSDYHMHEFAVNGQRYGIPAPEFDEPGEVIAEGRVRLEEVLSVLGARMLYTYDLGDYWQHSIQLESIHSPAPGATYPRVLAGGRSCPPEDCGGTGGYRDLLEILLDPTHEEFEDMRNWAGEFNAEVFSADAVNRRLRRNRSLAAKEQ